VARRNHVAENVTCIDNRGGENCWLPAVAWRGNDGGYQTVKSDPICGGLKAEYRA